MNDTLTVAIVAAAAAAAAPLLTFLGVWLERRVKHKNADAAVATADAAKETAEAAQSQAEAAKRQADAALVAAQAEMRRAVVAERDQAAADWARFCDANDHLLADLRKDVAANRRAIDLAETRAEAYRQERDEAEKNLRIAVAWIRRALRWITEQLPGASHPPLPPELDLFL